MRSKTRTKSIPNAIQGSTRGVRLLLRAGRPNPFGVQWPEWDFDAITGRKKRRVKTEFFATEADRDRRAATKREERRLALPRSPDRRELDDWREFRSAIGSTDWREVVRVWHAAQLKAGVIDSAQTVETWRGDYLKRLLARAEREEVALNTYRQHKHKLGLFAEHFGARALNRVDSADVAAWLQGCGLGNAGTFNNYRKILRVFFGDAVYHRQLAENPLERVKQRKLVRHEVQILTVPQIAQLFHTALTVERYRIGLWRLALETFAGVRFSSACRLTRADVHAEDKGIRHPAMSIKTQKRQYVSGFPDNLFAWLAVAPDDARLVYEDEQGRVNRERRYLELKSELFIAAGVPHPRNCLRHSFPSYHLAHRQDPGKTAYLLCHRNQQKLWDDYKGNATAAEGRRFEGITPQTAGVFAREWSARAAAEAGQPSEAARGPSPDRPESGPAPAGG